MGHARRDHRGDGAAARASRARRDRRARSSLERRDGARGSRSSARFPSLRSRSSCSTPRSRARSASASARCCSGASAATSDRCARSCARSARSASCDPRADGCVARARGIEPAGAAVVRVSAPPSRLHVLWDAALRRRRRARSRTPRWDAASCAASIPRARTSRSRRGWSTSRRPRALTSSSASPRASGAAIPVARERSAVARRAHARSIRSASSIAAFSETSHERRSSSRSARVRDPRHAARGRERGDQRVRALRLLPAGVPDVSHARGRERQPARPHLLMRALLEGDARARRSIACTRTSIGASAAAPARPRVRRACRTARCSRRRARRSREVKRPPLRARLILRAVRAARADARRGAARRDCCARRGLPKLLARLPGDLGFAIAMLASSESPLARARAHAAPRGDGSRGTFALLRGCVMEGLFTRANRATERTLVANDYTLVAAPDQRCCGALHAHAGDLETARTLARAQHRGVREVAAPSTSSTNAAGCGAMMKEYGHLLADDPEWAERAARLLGARARRERAARGRGPARRRAARRTRHVRRAVPPHARAARRRRAARGARRDSRARARAARRLATSAAAARASTTRRARRSRPRCSRRSSRTSSSPARRSSRPEIPDA